MIEMSANFRPPLEPGFQPAALWNRSYRALVARDTGARPFVLTLLRPDGTVLRHESRVLSCAHPSAALTLNYAERLVKFLLWQQGGARTLISGADEVAAELRCIYAPGGARAFDAEFMGAKVYGEPFAIAAVPADRLPAAREASLPLGRHLAGCRIGFDLGGSDRKVAAVIDGEVVFSEETRWDPYFQVNPAYHLAGVRESLHRAAAHLPRVDGIGSSAAGVYVNNEVRVASLFRGVTPERFEHEVRRMFISLREEWGGVPFEVANDGEVAALAGSMALCDGAVLGVSMGTSLAGGYVRPGGEITSWLNELAFAPVDYAPAAPRDEWSGDSGCGVQYFSQQAIARLAARAGLDLPSGLAAPEQLVAVQEAMGRGDPRAAAVFTTIGRCFGYAIAHYADFYELRHVLVLGRVTTGLGGEIILNEARAVLQGVFPDVAGRLQLHTPDEKNKRHGQAIAAASLPVVPAR
jgi:predicted NBD/HSP70 family sugar kinase